ncbi:hypothetical protein MHYP_G00086680 [Metynnis hypsauchen]
MDKLRNAEDITTQTAVLHKLKEEIKAQTALIQKLEQKMNECAKTLQRQKDMKQTSERETEQQTTQLQEQKTIRHAQKEEIDRQEMEKWKITEELRTQTILVQNLKLDLSKCEETLQRQKNIKWINEREIEQQTTQLQEQKIKIDTQKEEIDRQEREIQTNSRIIKQTRRKKQTLEKMIQTGEKQQQVKDEKFQKQVTELEKQKKLHEETVTVMRLEAEQNKYREVRRKQEDLHILQDIHDQLKDGFSSSTYMQDCDREQNLNELGKIIEKIKMEFQASLEQLEVLKKTQQRTEKGNERERSDALWDARDTCGETKQEQHKVSEENVPHKSFIKKMKDHPDSQDFNRKSTLKSLVEILQSLSLDSFYPNKMTMETFLTICSPNKEQSHSNVAFSYLQKLLMLNCRVRFMIGENKNQDCTLSTRTSGKCDRKEGIDVHGVPDGITDYEVIARETQVISDMEEISCEHNLDEVLSEKNDANNAKEKIHPMDVQMAVFHCTDSFLRQNMVTKLSSCQYALPLLVPSPTSTYIELLLWTFRQIKKTWTLADGCSTSLPVCQIKTPMVFFCRLGSVSTSKSQLLNSVINPKHDTFFHRNSPGNSRNRLFIEGLVEIAWYCPAGNNDDLFNKCLTFCNLHGDALDHRRQTDFFSEQATINVVLRQSMKPNDRDRELLEKLHKSSKPLICLNCDLQKGPLKVLNGLNVKIGLRGRKQDELHKELITAIAICLKKCNFSPNFNLEESSELAKQCGFRVDEDSMYCQEGKTRALEIMKLLEGEDISQIKVKFLPCQGKMWHEWARKNKELHRLHGEMEHARNVTLTEMNKIRMKQCANNLRFIKTFVKNLTSHSKTQTQYFVWWIRHFFDNKFSNKVSQLHLKYHSKWLEVQKLKSIPEKSELFTLQEQLDKISEELAKVTFGLEHIFREMGQIYEAWATVPEEMGADVSAFPAVAADLLISGQPLELMDGDAAHVPLTWIQSVLDKVTESLGDQRVFVLSVLGLQSSGKSTMLNTMFGLQFAVSAGRCTRGALMQLIRVKEEDKEQLKFDYLLVIDSEGLQSLKLLSKQSALIRNNELATFVTGLADLTLINISGENPAEMKDIIQIIVQAFLRMKKVKLTPSFMFVHQNFTDNSTGEKNIEGKMKLQEILDQMTQEMCNTQDSAYLSKFIPNVHYFAQLWEGNSPMAPPNPCYSENVESLKQIVLKAAAEKNCLKLSELKVRIKDLWAAVLNEDFAFSFKTIQTNSDECCEVKGDDSHQEDHT